MQTFKEIVHIFRASPAYKSRLFPVKDQDFGALVYTLEPLGSGFHLEGTRLKSQSYAGVFTKPVGHLVVVFQCVLADRAEINPTGQLGRPEMWPMVVIVFV